MKISNYDRGQYQRMRVAIAMYERRLLSFHNLIADLESLIRGLEIVSPDWHTALSELDTMERAHATVLIADRKLRSVLDNGTQNTVMTATTIKSLLASIPKLPCPCCSFLVFNEPTGSDEICPVCNWQDDSVQLRFPDMAGGANKPSLIDAKRNFAERGKSNIRKPAKVRHAAADESGPALECEGATDHQLTGGEARMSDSDAKAPLPRIECLITFIPASEGGRPQPFPAGAFSGDVYRPHLVIGDPSQRLPLLADGNRLTEEYLGVAFHRGPIDSAAGDEMTATLTLMYYPHVSYERLKPGVTFTIREGAQIVGFGSVVRLFGL